MTQYLAPILVLFAIFREIQELLKEPKYRAILFWVAIILGVGTIFYHSVEGWSWLDSLYFCVITLATIGYGDFAPLTELGKGFTIFYVFLGVGLIATFVTMLARERIEIYKERHPDDVTDSKLVK